MLAEIIIIGLAGYRLASFLVQEEGPFNIFEHIRKLAGVKTGVIEGPLATLFICMFCMTVWMTLAAWVVYEIEPKAAMILAAMTIALTADKFIQRD